MRTLIILVIAFVTTVTALSALLMRKSEQLGGMEAAYDSLMATNQIQEKMRKETELLLLNRENEKERLRNETDELKRQINDEAIKDPIVNNYLNSVIPIVILNRLRDQKAPSNNDKGDPSSSVNSELPKPDDKGKYQQASGGIRS